MTAQDRPNLAALPPLWDAAREEELVCRGVQQETHDVRTFVFSAASPRLFRFLPGQFLTFEFEVEGQAISRCYTIASPPTRPDRLCITVKRKQGGVVSPWLHAQFRAGASVRVTGPMGDFTPTLEPGARYLLLSAGSGITPLMATARTLADLGGEADVVLAHGAHTPDDVIFGEELALLGSRTGFRVAIHCSRDGARERWGGLRGRLTPSMLEVIAPDYMTREIYVCGPTGYMDHVRAILVRAGVAMSRHHEESFDFARLAAAEPEIVAPVVATEGFRIELTRSGRILACAPDTKLLDAARQAGLRLPSSCTRGVCGTCKSRLLSGKVDMQHGGGIRPREIDAGLILLCCSKPMSDLVIER